VFRDPSAVKRTATSVNWHPEGNRIAVAYSILKFQDERLMSGRLPPSSFVWDVTYPNHPVRPPAAGRWLSSHPAASGLLRPRARMTGGLVAPPVCLPA